MHVFAILRNTICEYCILYKFKLSTAMQGFLRYHKCTCKYKTIQCACYPGYITHTCIYSICLRLSSQVILQIFTSKKDQYWLSKEKNVKRHNFKHIIHVFFNCNFFFCIFLDHCSFRTPGYGNTPGIPRAYSKLPSLRTGRVSISAAIFLFFYIFIRL